MGHRGRFVSGESRHERVYRRLLRLYPATFRDRFGDEMVQLFGDQVRDANSRGSGWGRAEIWLRTVWDLTLTASSEHRRARTVAQSLSAQPSLAMRALGLLGIIGGTLLLASFFAPFIPWDLLTYSLRLVLFNVGAIAIAVAVHRRQVSVGRTWSPIAVAAVILANAWYIVMTLLGLGRPVFPEPDPEFRQIFVYAAMALWLSDAAFGAVALRLRTVSRVGALALTVGSALLVISLSLGGPDGPLAGLIWPLSLVGVFLVGVGWIWLGVDVVTKRRPIPSPNPTS